MQHTGLATATGKSNSGMLSQISARLGTSGGAALAFLLITAVGSALSPYFLTQRNLTNVFLQASMLGVVAIGTTFVILTGGVDLSVEVCAVS